MKFTYEYEKKLRFGTRISILKTCFHPEYFHDARVVMASCSPHTDRTDEINDPGAAPFGNFINYYTFNPPENRLNLIPATLLRDLNGNGDITLILDVGCNSGVCMKDRFFGFLKDKI